MEKFSEPRPIQKLRIDLGMTLRDAAKMSGVNHSMIQKIETHAVINPSIDVCHSLAYAYGLDLDILWYFLFPIPMAEK